jgi:hypothetical protein
MLVGGVNEVGEEDSSLAEGGDERKLGQWVLIEKVTDKFLKMLMMSITARYDLMTMARLGLISCLRAALEKSMMTDTNRIRLFLFIDELKESIVCFFVNFFSAAVCFLIEISWSP